MEKPYLEADVLSSYRWLGHKKLTELNAYHPLYKAGREHLEENKRNSAFPKIRYVRNGNEALRFVEACSGSNTVCYGLNTRAHIFRNEKGFPRSAYEHEIEAAQNMLFDLDFRGGDFSEAARTAVEEFIERSKGFFFDQDLKAPVKAYSGRGYHQLLAFPEIKIAEHPDIAERQKCFAEMYRQAYRRELENLEAKLDSTQDLRRMVKIYGTAKPEVGIISRWLYQGERVEDEALRDYLLGIDLKAEAAQATSYSGTNALRLGISAELPLWFQSMLARDKQIRELWEGEGKAEAKDISRSGYDFSLVKLLLDLGYRNLDDLAAILANRPDGDVQGRDKGSQYIKRTIANALLR